MVYYVRKASYDPPEQPLLNREVRGRLRAGRRLATPAQNWSQSTVASQYLVFVQYCRGAADITAYKLGRRCTAMVWLTLTNTVTRLDPGHITNMGGSRVTVVSMLAYPALGGSWLAGSRVTVRGG